MVTVASHGNMDEPINLVIITITQIYSSVDEPKTVTDKLLINGFAYLN